MREVGGIGREVQDWAAVINDGVSYGAATTRVTSVGFGVVSVLEED